MSTNTGVSKQCEKTRRHFSHLPKVQSSIIKYLLNNENHKSQIYFTAITKYMHYKTSFFHQFSSILK